MPFVQGHYTNAAASAHIESTCECCDAPIVFDLDQDLQFSLEDDSEPLIFVKRVDFRKLEDPSIIDAF